ncbi:heat-inducible transcriptional repressor HrcA [Arthrobacter sp. MYb211]|uniref:heat-inducible transcriptional repressor HrcA n=1 Tax=unclassified Arthrobacter TaxID=235627 RepID=UPI000CFBA72F|nr:MULTISPECIES: heat-inducible transcriptional repressor HrcA [unclassified Arthrobacter]PRA01133.1 heat-inducible transcriptional repressor HrcA [Arthrobacter sp. MYb224]PRA13846.1 heat-inducible transcriptional repressor HrcA [Arthrobacter sp. MYb221]PRC09216.1 heat-inducible transcriptional repressor HrcA [Arthrobacter sp. MYb211]
MSEFRRLDVLRAIVEDYVQSHEPVGSKALLDRHNLGVSAATIRNDMALLEEEGLIAAPHTSSGRIPTEKGYRRFVDQIGELKPLSRAEREAINKILDNSQDLDEVLHSTVRLLARLTNQVALIQVPHYDTASLRNLDLVGLGSSQVLMVMIASNGTVDQRMIGTSRAYSDDELQGMKQGVLKAFGGRQLADLVGSLATESIPLQLLEDTLFMTVLGSLQEMARAANTQRIVMAGTANLARSVGDFPLTLTPVLEALEEQVVLLKLFSELEADSRGVAVAIGTEHHYGQLSDATVIATTYGSDTRNKLGVLGPTRMNYPTSMSSVRAVARYLSKILTN